MLPRNSTRPCRLFSSNTRIAHCWMDWKNVTYRAFAGEVGLDSFEAYSTAKKRQYEYEIVHLQQQANSAQNSRC